MDARDRKLVAEVLGRHFHPRPIRRVERVLATGFSGASLWQVATEGATLCLRRWPPGRLAPERLAWIQTVIKHVSASGFGLVSESVETVGGEGHVAFDGCLWELSRWLPGMADTSARPSNERISAAFAALAQFHELAQSLPRAEPWPVAVSSGMTYRQSRWSRLVSTQWPIRARQAMSAAPADEARMLAEQILDVATRLASAAVEPLSLVSAATRLTPCLCDVWREHVLFFDDRVSGIVDYGAMRLESVAADIARLLGSLVGDDAEGRRHALAAYESVRGLTNIEVQFVEAFDRLNVLLSGLEWVDWLYIEGRRFENMASVTARLREILARLAVLSRTAGAR